MAISKTLFGVTVIVPETDETDWGGEVTNILTDVVDGVDSSNYQLASTVVVEKQASTNVTPSASGTLTPTPRVIRLGTTPSVTLSATTAISDGEVNGQMLTLQGASGFAGTTTIQDGANTKLNGAMVVAAYDSIELRWDGSDWVEISRSN